MATRPDLEARLDLREELARIDRQRDELMVEVRAIMPVTTMTLVYGALLMLVPLAFGAALVKLYF